VILAPAVATPLGLMLHELSTNAAKHGALGNSGGSARLNWETRDLEGGARVLRLVWSESGGPPVTAPKKAGAGFQLIDHGIADLKITREFKPEGLVCILTAPLVAAPAISKRI
jgi:two-component system CheB/CheR fusion protein